MNRIVLYKSKYGTAKQYATWLARSLQCDMEPADRIKADALSGYDLILYVGGIYVAKVNGFKEFAKHLNQLTDKKIILCMTGMTDPAETEVYRKIYLSAVPEPYRANVKPFALHGDLLFSKMSIPHRLVMKMLKAEAEKKTAQAHTEIEKSVIENYGKDSGFAIEENIQAVIAYIKKQGKPL